MKKLLIILLIFWTTGIVGQGLDKGIYRGQKLLEICYFTYNDTTVEVEYFYLKGGQIFAHYTAKKLVASLESASTKPTFLSTDDSVQVFTRKNYYLIKRKKGNKKYRIKVYKSEVTHAEIIALRNKHKEYISLHDNYNKY